MTGNRKKERPVKRVRFGEVYIMYHQNPLAAARKERGVLVAAHRGVSGGNIPCNSIAAFEAALRQGADILETDLALSGDGVLLAFHPKKERCHLNMDVHLDEMTMEQIRELRYVNIDNDPTPYGILTLDEFLETFKNRCLINLDHGWDNDIALMINAIRRHAMEDQILIKTPAKLKHFQAVEELAPELMYMPILKDEDTVTEVLEKMNINFVGAELVFSKEDSIFCQEEYIRSHHDKGRMLWVNPILYYYKAQLTGGHNDDIAATSDPEFGWGWLVDKGYDILQTDWVMPMRHFLNNRK